jgi:multisubunit Na+/H+ antiporter MnhB subunit
VTWLLEAIKDSKTGAVSSRRVGFLIATSALGASVLILSMAFFYGHDTSVALGAVSVPLAGLGGYSFVNGNKTDGKGTQA